MNTDNLRVGDILKNYKHLCEILEITPKGKAGSTQRQAQVKDIKRHIDYKKLEGRNSIIILKIYDEIKSVTYKTSNNSKYINHIENIILYTLSNLNSERCVLAKGKLLEICNMINENYRYGRNNIKKIIELTEIEAEYIYSFYSTSDNMLTKTIKTALNSLSNRRLIDYYDCITICENIVKEVVDKNGFTQEITTGEYTYREATYYERQLILNYEKIVINQMGYRGIQEIVLKGKWKIFKAHSEKLIREKYNSNINYYYNSYNIVYNEKHIKEEITQTQIKSDRKELNNKVCNAIKTTVETKHKNKVKKNTAIGTLVPLEAKNDYVIKQNELIELLLKEEPTARIK